MLHSVVLVAFDYLINVEPAESLTNLMFLPVEILMKICHIIHSQVIDYVDRGGKHFMVILG